MKASVIISAFNNLNDLSLLLPSLERQALGRHQMEVVLRDDGSRDGTCDWVKAKHPWVNLICGENVGFSKSNNIAVGHTTGDVFVFVNADTVVDQRLIASGLDAFERQPQVGGLNCNMIMPWVMDMEDFLAGQRAASGYGFCLNRFGFTDYRDVGRAPCAAIFISGGGCFVRRSALNNEAPFAEDLWGGTAYCEDLDLSLRLLAKGWQLCFEPAAILYHNQRPICDAGFFQLLKFIRVSVNRITVYALNLSLSSFLGFLPGLFYGIFKKVDHLSMPEKLKRKSLMAAAVVLPFLTMLFPYWIFLNIRSSSVRTQIPDLFFLKGKV